MQEPTGLFFLYNGWAIRWTVALLHNSSWQENGSQNFFAFLGSQLMLWANRKVGDERAINLFWRFCRLRGLPGCDGEHQKMNRFTNIHFWFTRSEVLSLYSVQKYKLRRIPSPGLLPVQCRLIPVTFSFGGGRWFQGICSDGIKKPKQALLSKHADSYTCKEPNCP